MSEKQKLINSAIEEYVNSDIYERSINDLSEKYGLNRKTIVRHLKASGIEITNSHGKAKINSDIFEVIDTEEKAYWLGFLYADGCIYANGKSVSLGLSQADHDHIVKFNNFLGRNKAVYVKTNGKDKNGGQLWCSEVRFNDAKVWSDLNNKGITPNKSLTIKFPNKDIFKTNDLIRHFIRGYFDGDGCVTWCNSNRTTPSVNIIGTLDFLKGIESEFGDNAYICHKKNKSDEVFTFKLTNLKAFKFLEYIYKDSTIYLERKYNRYLNFVPSYSGKGK
jgi:hypothetical protein